MSATFQAQAERGEAARSRNGLGKRLAGSIQLHWVGYASVTFLLAAWCVITLGLKVESLPSPVTIGGTIRTLVAHGYEGYSIWQQIGATVARALVGFALGSTVGVAIGLAMGRSRLVHEALNPLFAFLRPIPLIAFIPLFIAYFGIGELPKILVIFLAAFYFVVLNTEKAVHTVSRDLIKVGENFNLSRTAMLRHVIIPGAMPGILAGLRIGAIMSWSIVVTAELIGAQVGLGHMIEDASTFFDLPVVYVGIAIIGVIGLLMDAGLSLVERRALHWVGR